MRLLAAVLAGACACTPPFYIPSSTEIQVPGEGILGGNPLLPEQVFPSDLIADALVESINQSFDTSGYDKGSVKSLQLTALSLTVTNPDEQGGRQLRDLSFLEKLTVFLGAPNTDPTKVAESDETGFVEGQLEYSVPVTQAELAGAFKASDALDMTADVDPGDPPQFATDVRIDTVLTVQLGL
jgi:hypothetical protein